MLDLIEQRTAAGAEDIGFDPGLRILARYGLGSQAERLRILDELRDTEDAVRFRVLATASATGPPELLRASLDLERERPYVLPPEKQWRMALRRGRPREALRLFGNAKVDPSSMEPVDDGFRLVLETRIMLVPFHDPARADLVRLRDELLAFPADTVSRPADHGASDFGLQRLQALGALSVALNDLEAADRYAKELERLHGLDAYGIAARVRSHSVRALMARAQGRPAEALQLVEKVEREMFSLCDWCTGSASRADFTFERFMRAELLRELGREEEALRYYQLDELGEPSYPISHLRVAEIHDRHGRREQAIYHYAMFSLKWRDAEPELQPLVKQAERRLAALRRS
jgi:tetratricopeptide (TPR) repeat protein